MFHLWDDQRRLGEDVKLLLSATHGHLEMKALPVWACSQCGAVSRSRQVADECCISDEPQSRDENWMFGAVKLVVECRQEEIEDEEYD